MSRFARILTAVLLVLTGLVLAGSRVAVAGSNTFGTVQGTVTDDKGNPLPGVTVTVKSDALIREKAITTDGQGKFIVSGLPPGRYTVVGQLTGYTKTAIDTTVELDKTTPVNISLRTGEMSETVSIVAPKPVVEKTATEGSKVVSREFADTLPLGRTYQSLVPLAPGVTSPTNGANPNILGGTSNSNNFLFDGQSTRDPVTGTFGSNLTYDSIDEVDVKLFGVSAEYGQFQGGLLSVVTKSGGNQFTGSARDVLTSNSWQYPFKKSTQDEFKPADPVNVPTYTVPVIPPRGADLKNNDVQTTLGGPIVQDSAWFFISYTRTEGPRTIILADPNGGPNGDGIFSAATSGDFSLIKATWQATDRHKLQYEYVEDPFIVPVCYSIFFGGSCAEQYNVERQQQGGLFWVSNWQAVWGNNWLTDFKLTHFKNGFPGNTPEAPVPDRPGLPLSSHGDIALGVDVNTGNIYDNTVFAPNPDDRFRDQYEASVTHFVSTAGGGSHNFKVGLDYQKTTREGASTIAGNAIFYFTFVDPSADLYDVNNRIYYAWTDFALPGSGAHFNKTTSLYALDDWQPNQHWAFNLGIRFEKSVNENDVGEKIIDDNGFAPRLGATFDIRGDGKDLVKATAARYLAGINLTTLSPFIRAAGGQSSYDLYTNTSPDPGTPTWLLTGSVRPDTASATFADGIKPQAIDELTLGYEHAFSPTFGMTLRGVYRDWKDIITETFAYTYPPPDGIATKTLRIDNNGDAKRTYKGVILTAEKSFGAKWQIDGNYTYSKAEGNVISEDGFDTFESFAGVPQTTANRDGFLPWDARHLLKIYGFYHIPINSPRHALTVAANYSYASGNAYAKNNTASFDSGLVVGPGPDGVQDVPLGSSGVAAAGTDDQTDTSVVQFLEPRGSRTEPSQWTLGLALNYNFSFSKRVTWETQFEVFNVTNNQSPLSVQSNYFANPTTASQIRSNYVFGTPSSYSLTGTPQFQTPRTYQFQFGVLW